MVLDTYKFLEKLNMVVSTKNRNVSRSKSNTFSKSNKVSRSRKQLIKYRKSGMKTRKMRGGGNHRFDEIVIKPNDNLKELKRLEKLLHSSNDLNSIKIEHNYLKNIQSNNILNNEQVLFKKILDYIPEYLKKNTVKIISITFQNVDEIIKIIESLYTNTSVERLFIRGIDYNYNKYDNSEVGLFNKNRVLLCNALCNLLEQNNTIKNIVVSNNKFNSDQTTKLKTIFNEKKKKMLDFKLSIINVKLVNHDTNNVDYSKENYML